MPLLSSRSCSHRIAPRALRAGLQALPDKTVLIAAILVAGGLHSNAASAQKTAPPASPTVSQPRPLDPDTLPPAAASLPSGALSPWTIAGYGESILSTRFYGPDPNVAYKPGDYTQTDVDLARVVFDLGYNFTSWLSFQTEIEFEHGGTGATMEVEWDEFGEYEVEIEKGGEVVLEQAFLQATFGSYPLQGGVALGHILAAVGTIAPHHRPNHFSSVYRPESEEALIPSTWHESGAEAFARFAGFNLRLQVLTGLDSTGFSSAGWIAGGSQQRFELSRANDWAVAARLDYGRPGATMGLSGYTSNTTGNRPKRDMKEVDARVWLGELHGRFQVGPLRIRSMAMVGTLNNADLITEKNGSLSQYLEVPRTPVGSSAYALYLETALDLVRLFVGSSKYRFDLFARGDFYDTMWTPPDPDSGFDMPILERRVLTSGINFFPHPRVVLKADYVWRWMNENNDWGRQQQQFNFGLGFVL